MKKRCPTPLLLLLAAAAWLGVCVFQQMVVRAYDSAVIANNWYLWFWGPAFMLGRWLHAGEGQEQSAKPGSRRIGDVIVFFVATALAFLLACDRRSPRYSLLLWLCVALVLGCLADVLLRRPSRQKKADPVRDSAAGVLSVYLLFGLTLLLFLAVHRPLTVAQARLAGEAEGGEFIGHITGDPAQTPLGVYWFRGEARDCCYDVLTGERVEYGPPGYPGCSPR